MIAVRQALLVALCAIVVGCQDSPSADDPPPESPWAASFEQDRPDQDTPHAQIKASNNTSQPETVRGVRLTWSGYAPGPWQAADMAYDPGHVHRLEVRLTAPRCEQEPDDRPKAELRLADGSFVSVPLDDPGVEVLHQIWVRQCGEQRLLEAVDVRFGGWHQVRRAGEPALQGFVAARRGRTDAIVTMPLTRGSVLLDLDFAGTRHQLLGPTDDTGRLPLVIRSSGRCDPHAVGQATQRYTLRIWLSLDRGPEQSVVFRPGPELRPRMDSLIRETCNLDER